jgi:hypothetical protein
MKHSLSLSAACALIAAAGFACSSGGSGGLLDDGPGVGSSSGAPTGSSSSGNSSSSGGQLTDSGIARDSGVLTDSAVAQDSGSSADAAVQRDAGTDAAAPTNAFTGAAAFVAGNNNAPARNGPHQGTGGPAKLGCVVAACHGAGGSGPKWAFGGTVFTDAAGTTPAAGVQIAVRDRGGKAQIVRSNADGNFWAPAGAANPAFPAKTGARTAAATALMDGDITDGNCNGCHTGGAGTAFIHVP